MALENSSTLENLKQSFANESQANRRYLWFAELADVEGFPEIAAAFRSIAEVKTGHAHGLLEYLAEDGDPATGAPIGDTSDNVAAVLDAESSPADEYEGFATTARTEGFDEIGDWFETLARAETRAQARLTTAAEHLRNR